MDQISDYKTFRVSSGTNCSKLASGLFKELAKNPPTKLKIKAVGASALNQAIKSIATLNSSLASKGQQASFIPFFSEVEFKDSDKPYTAISLKLIIHNL